MREQVFNRMMNRKRREFRKHARINAQMIRDTADVRESQVKPGDPSLELGKLLHINQEVWS